MGPCEEAVWRSRYNEELYRLYDVADLVTRWAGHVMRMQDNLPCKKIPWISRRAEDEQEGQT
jgi:hypothetical protein